VTIRNNLIRNVGAGINLAGREGSNKNQVDSLLRRVTIENNLMTDVRVPPYRGEGRLIQLLANVSDVIIRQSTFVSTAPLNSFLNLDRTNAARNVTIENVVFSSGQFGLFASGRGQGANALAAVSGNVRINNVMVVSQRRQQRYPPGIRFVPSIEAARAMRGAGVDEARLRAALQGVESVVP
jgi:hypothetical protein